MPARSLAIPPQPALLVGADGRWLAAADLLSRDLGVVIIDPCGRFATVAERRGARSVTPPADALNPLDHGDDGDAHAPALHVDLSQLPAGRRAAGMLLALDDARRRARPDRPLLVVVDDADELFRDAPEVEWLGRADQGVILRLLTSRPDRILADDGGAAIIRELAIKLITPGDQDTLDTLQAAGLITPAEAEHMRDSEPDEMLVIRDDERSFLRIAWLLEHPRHADVLRALATAAG